MCRTSDPRDLQIDRVDDVIAGACERVSWKCDEGSGEIHPQDYVSNGHQYQ